MPTGDLPPAARCCCNQHRPQFFVRGINASGTSPLVGRVSFSSNAASSTVKIYWCTACNRQKRGSTYAGIPSEGYCECPPIALGLHPDSEQGASPEPGYSRHAHPGMVEHVQRAVDDYMAGLPEVEDDAATVVELIQRGESWHVSVRAGAMMYKNAEGSLGAALESVRRVLGEKPERCEAVGNKSGLRCQEAAGHLCPHSARRDDPFEFEAWRNETRRGYAP